MNTIKTNTIYTKTLRNGQTKSVLVIAPAEPDEKGRAYWTIKTADGKDSKILESTLATYEEDLEATKAYEAAAVATAEAESEPEKVAEADAAPKAKRNGKRTEAKAANLVAVLEAVKAAGGEPSNSPTKPYRVSVKRNGKRIAVMDVCSDHIVVELKRGPHHGDHTCDTTSPVWVAELTAWLLAAEPFRASAAAK